MSMISGVYRIRNLINGKIYIGSSNNILRRWKIHKRELIKGIHVNLKLQRAWIKYGENSFVFEVVEETSSEEKILLEREQIWLDLKRPFEGELGYNINPIADKPPNLRGRKKPPVSDETRRRMSEALKGRKRDPKLVKRTADALRGRKRDPEIMKRAAETRKRNNKPNPLKGKKRQPMLEEVKRKISQANKGKIRSEEFKKRISETSTGRKVPEHVREMHRRRMTGRLVTKETRSRISDGLKKYYKENPGTNSGRKFSAEVRKRMSEAQKKLCKDPEHLEKLKRTLKHATAVRYGKEKLVQQ